MADPLVKETVAHILFHVDFEAANSDPSQVPGVADRAKLVHDTLLSFEDDGRTLAPEAARSEFRNAVPDDPNKDSLVRTIDNIEQRPQLALQAWVGENRETR